MSQTGILLEVGTNELEVLEIAVGEGRYGVNVAKIREIIPYTGERVTRLPGSAPYVIGTLLLRDRPVLLVDLAMYLGEPPADGSRVAVVTRLNDHECGFVVSSVDQIHRVSWRDMVPLQYLDRFDTPLSGSVRVEGEPMLMLDLERILGELLPESSIDLDAERLLASPPVIDVGKSRSGHLLWMAEDSVSVRRIVDNSLNSAGYDQVRSFGDGELLWKELVAAQTLPHLIVSDVEMPQLDGLTLCRRIKEHERFKHIQVVMFSSLVQADFAEKCRQVGADGWLTKPQVRMLVSIVDGLLGLGPKHVMTALSDMS